MDLADAGKIQLSLKANGPLADVKGNLNLEVDRYGKADLDFQAGLKETIAAALNGRIRPDERIIPEDVAKALGGLDFALQARAALSPSRILEVQRLHIRNGYCRPFPERCSGSCEGNHGDEGRVFRCKHLPVP